MEFAKLKENENYGDTLGYVTTTDVGDLDQALTEILNEIHKAKNLGYSIVGFRVLNLIEDSSKLKLEVYVSDKRRIIP